MTTDTEQPAPRHIVILCHPEQESFNASVAHAYCSAVRGRGHQAIVRDLYAMGFKPVLKSVERPGPDFKRFPDVEEELAIIRGADVFVLVYPIWFGTPPAMLKGYIERVLGSAVEPSAVQARAAEGVLAGKRLVSFTSSATTEIWLDLQGQLQSLKNGFDHYLRNAFGMLLSRHFHYGHIVPGLNPKFVRQHLADIDMHARTIAREIDDARAAATEAGTATAPSPV